jgi:phosphatidylglycerol:prolipoprotein diacylglycerol transferase
MHPLIPCTERVIFPLGKLPVVPDWLNIHGFGVMVALGLWLGGNMAGRKAQRDGLDPKIISEIVGWIVVGIFVGGHLGHLLFYEPKELLRDPLVIFKVWDGLSSFGGFIACTLIVVWLIKGKNDAIRRENVKRKDAGTPLQPLLPGLGYADSLVYGLTLGWLLGRFGCFLAHDHPGIATDFWLGVYGICPPQHTPLCQSVGVACHDLGLYESIWGGLMTLVFVALDKKPRPPGWFVGVYVLVYGPTRFLLDFLRARGVEGADVRYFGLTPAQYGALALIAIGIFLLSRSKGKVPYRVVNQTAA